MLGFEPTVPVDFRIVECIRAVLFMDLNTHVWVTSEDLVAESPVLALFANFVNFVDHGTDIGVFVQKDIGDQLSVGKITFSQIQMR